jgi:hypothetical protein
MRTITDLQAMRELNGDERRGTVVSELTGAPIPDDGDNVAVSALLKLADKLGTPANVKQQIRDLTAAADAAKAEQAALSKIAPTWRPTWLTPIPNTRG